MTVCSDQEIARLIERLDSLIDGERAAMALVACGQPAVQALQRFLLDGRPRALYQPRRWAVRALSALSAKTVLMEYLRSPAWIVDPVVQFAEDEVRGEAARELAGWASEDVFRLLREIAETAMLAGVIEALSRFRRVDAVPYLVRALEDDFCREAAEQGLRALGAAARPALLVAAATPLPARGEERPSSLRRRRSAVTLLSEIGITSGDWTTLEPLLGENDLEIQVETCRLALAVGVSFDVTRTRDALIVALPGAPWFLADRIEECLAAMFAEDRGALERQIRATFAREREAGDRDPLLQALRRVKRRLDTVRTA